MSPDDTRPDESFGSDASFDDDAILEQLSQAPGVAPAGSDQIERTWQAIEGQVEALERERASGAESLAASTVGRESASPGWLERLFPSTPTWSWQLAQVASILLLGFGAAWFAAGQGWLPGTIDTEVASTPPEVVDAGPDRTWLASNDHGDRLEALFLGVARSDTANTSDVAPAAREVSRELLGDNRFYQRVARRNGDAALADLLSRIEIILLAVANAPEGQEQVAVDALREVIEETGLLGELRDVRSSVPRNPRSGSLSGS